VSKSSFRVCFLIIMTVFICACAPKEPSSAVSSQEWIAKNFQVDDCLPGYIRARLYIAWDEEKSALSNALRSGASVGKPTALYNAQSFTNNLLEAAAACQELGLLSELSAYISIPFEYLKVHDGIRTWADEDGNVVNTLSRSQFLFLVSRAVNIISSLPVSVRTEAMDVLLETAPKVAYAHYKSWIIDRPSFQVTGWGCHGHDEDAVKRDGRSYFNHHDFLKYKRAEELTADANEPRFCNAITDVDMWIVAGLVELLASHDQSVKIFEISDRDRKALDAYLSTAVIAIREGLAKTRVKDFKGDAVAGIVFEPGIWNEHPENAYTAYSGTSYPTDKEKGTVPDVSWDISHARRFVHVFAALRRNMGMTAGHFPGDEIMRRFANQYSYRVFNRNFAHPLFSNFFDGTNGWYRVGYAGREKFGYGPYKLSNAAVTGGFGFWKKYNSDVEKINKALWKMLRSNNPSVKKFVEKYYHSTDGARNLALIQFLPVFVKN